MTLDIRSSWIVENGFARPASEPNLLPRQRGYRCGVCGKLGRCARSCKEK